MKEQQSNELKALEKAALMIKQLKDKLEQQDRLHHAPVAVVGMACRFPGGMNSAGEFWNGLLKGIDTVGTLPVERWEQADKTQVLYGSFIKDIEAFDAGFFGISPREAKAMDPQQRLLMETSWHALEDAGIPPAQLKGTQTGIFVGAMSHDYSEWSYEEGLVDVYTGTGTSNSILAGRLSHFYDVNGPAMTIDTACSSSLVAIHQAVRSLRSGESDTCIVAGVNAILSPSLYTIEITNQMLSPDGRCKTFDAQANGFARGEGAGVVILKRLDAAIKDNDRIYCVIKGSAVNHDGKSTGLMAPSQSAQEKLLKAALKDAKLQNTQVDFVECHGTGTTLGDPVEVGALQEVYGKNRNTPLYVGAVKSNTGHLEGAAGIAGFMKMALSVYNSVIPPNVHFNNINPYIDNRNINIPQKSVPWHTDKRIGGISSFGFSGTNAHVIAEAFIQQLETATASAYLPLAFSASSVAALTGYIQSFNTTAVTTAQSYTLSCRREHLQYRQLFFNPTDINAVTEAKAADWIKVKPKVVFLFSGQGAQYKDMGMLLYKHHLVFKRYFDECNSVYKKVTGNDLLDYISGGKADEINRTSVTQPALFAVSYATACTWREHGVEPSALIGHSIGEWAAACFAGMISLEDAIRLVVKRGELMEATASGSMYAVNASYVSVRGDIATFDVDVAAMNAPEQVVISGSNEAVDKLVQHLQQQGIKCRQLNVTRAFHSRLMNDAAKEFGALVKTVSFADARYPIYSNIDGALLTPALISDGYWEKQIISPVNFTLCVDKIQDDSLLIETGSGNALLNLAQRTKPGFADALPGACTATHSDAFYKSFKTVFEKGYSVNFEPFFDKKYFPVSLPPYAFQRTPYWIKDEIKTHLQRNKPATPAQYRRNWAVINMPALQSGSANIYTETFTVNEGVYDAGETLLRFSQLLSQFIKGNNERVVIVADVQRVDAPYRYSIGMALLACLQSAMLEQQGLFYGMLLKLDNSEINPGVLAALFQQPTALLLQHNTLQQLHWYRDEEKGEGLHLRSDKSYIIYGGSGSVGLEIAKYLSEKKAGSIVLTGRRKYEMLDITYQYTIDKLKQKGANVSYHTINDTTVELDGMAAQLPYAIGGIINAAGSYTNLAISSYTTGALASVLKPKVNDTIALLAFCKKQGAEFLLNCSSAVTLTGAPMLGHYAFANAFMDGIAEEEKSIKVYSVAWGGWKGSNMLSDAENESFQQRWGFTAVAAAGMLSVFENIKPGCTAVLDIQWDKFFIAGHSAKKYVPLQGFTPKNMAPATEKTNVALTPLQSKKDIYDSVYRITAGILQTDAARLDSTLPFDELGFNSLLALELSTGLNTILGIELSSTVVYEHTTPEKLAKYIAGLLVQDMVLPAVQENDSKVFAGDDVDDMSLEELKSLLDKKINN